MDIRSREDEVASFLELWFHCLVTKDPGAAAGLRADGYRAALPNRLTLDAAQEAEMISSPLIRFSAPEIARIDFGPGGEEAIIHYSLDVEYSGEAPVRQRGELLLARIDGMWRARRSGLGSGAAAVEPVSGGRLAALARRLRRSVRRPGKAPRAGEAGPSVIRDRPYVPYRGGADYVVKASDLGSPPGADEALPIPPESLWLGYHYPMHGKAQVDTMLEIVDASGFSFHPGDRILDLGCGAGRMIRHLRHLAETCEIWGADIAAEPIFWCKHNLSPPFRFLTNTKVPHLPFEDRSFRLIYCGSLFTHIDELADGWLLELHRLLAEDGRLYVTIQDKHSVELFDDRRYASAKLVERIKSYPLFTQAAPDFQVLALGREGNPHMFYDLDYFARMAGGAFEILSVTPEAYFYQTALLLKRSAKS